MRKLDFLNKSFVHLALIALLGLAAYSNTFDAPFVFDDEKNIIENPIIKDFSYLTDPSKARGHKIYDIFEGRYIGYLTFALNWRAHGLDVRGYHATNIAIHLLNALLVYFLVVLTFRTPRLQRSELSENAKHIALFSALLFVSHPVQTQAVTYIVQRFASVATLFYMLSLAAYIRARLAERNPARYGLYALSLISAILAMKTKEIAFTLPLVIALYEFLFFSDSIKRRLIYLMPLLLTMLIIPLSMLDTDRPLGEIIGDVSEAARLETGMSRPDYLFTEFRVVVTYIRLLFLPVNQNLDYDYPIYTSFLEPQVFLSFLLLASIIGLGGFLLRRSRTSEPELRIMTFGIFWFFITLSVESSLIPIDDVIFEHRLYLPGVGAFTAIAAGAVFLFRKFKGKKLRAVIVLTLCMVPLVLASATYARNRVWTSQISLWEDTVRKSPLKARAHNNLGFAYYNKILADKAIEQYLIALELDPEYYLAYNNLGVVYEARGLTDKRIEAYRATIKINPRFAKAHNNLGKAYLTKGFVDKAIEHFRIAVRLRPYFAKAHSNLAVAYERKGLHEKAEEHRRIAESIK